METNGTTAKVLDALGDPTRRRILEIVRDGALPVGRIASRLPVSRPAVSQHLRVLKEAGLVRDRHEGTRRVYAVDQAGLEALRAYLETFWDATLAAFKEAAEAPSEEGRP
ncbi:MAG TPA: metalloregulator ArsR/SmtB family transcription factor [Actinomycetota bacterium]|nr:metalloregulator ArsR/SmtB family transcription factor [Actinomycetota bacterium]